MDIVWKQDECSVRDAQKLLGRKLAYTTVATILQRLWDKGLVARNENEQVYVYSPKLSRESYSKNLAKTFFQKFFNSFGDVAMASFAETIDGLPSEKKKYLLKILSKNEKSK